MARTKRDKLRADYKLRRTQEAATKVADNYPCAGYSYRLSYTIAPKDARPYLYRTHCPVEGCGETLEEDAPTLKLAYSMIKGRIETHVARNHPAGA